MVGKNEFINIIEFKSPLDGVSFIVMHVINPLSRKIDSSYHFTSIEKAHEKAKLLGLPVKAVYTCKLESINKDKEQYYA